MAVCIGRNAFWIIVCACDFSALSANKNSLSWTTASWYMWTVNSVTLRHSKHIHVV